MELALLYNNKILLLFAIHVIWHFSHDKHSSAIMWASEGSHFAHAQCPLNRLRTFKFSRIANMEFA